MKTAAHQYEDKLLEFAYGELPREEADAVDAHVRGCANCARALDEIKGVRATMAQLPMASAPDAGLDSLLAYAEQAARRNVEAAKPQPSFFKRFMAPLVTLMALTVVGVVGLRARDEFDTSPASVKAEGRLEEHAKAKSAEQAPSKDLLAQGDSPVAGAQPPAAAPAQIAAATTRADERQNEDGKANDEAADLNALAGKTLEAPATEKAEFKKSISQKQEALRRSVSKVSKLDTAEGEGAIEDYSNARGGYVGGVKSKSAFAPKDAKPAPREEPAPPPAPAEVADKNADARLTFGLGSGPTGNVAAQPARDVVPEPSKEQAAAPKPVSKSPAPSTAPTTPPAYAYDSLGTASTASANKKGSIALSPMASSAGGGRVMQEEALKAPGRASGAADDDQSLVMQQRAQFRGDAVEAMRVAGNNGAHTEEIQLAQKVLKMGATGVERAEALKHLCDAYDSLGETGQADTYCNALLKEFPSSAAAQRIAERRNAQRVAPSKKAADRERKYMPEADDAKKAEPASLK